MHPTTRKLYPLLALSALVGATLWATSFGTLPPADFTFNNGTEVKSIDPAQVTGAPEGRMIHAVFEGLYRPDPKTLQPQPGIATTAVATDIISNRGKTYTFPRYTGRTHLMVKEGHGNISALSGTKVKLTLHLNQPVKMAMMDMVTETATNKLNLQPLSLHLNQ